MSSKNPILSEVETYEVRIFIGSVEGYDGSQFTQTDLVHVVQEFQSLASDYCSVIITDVVYVASAYYEDGWQITITNYPRFPKERQFILDWTIQLASFLITELKQERLTIMEGGKTYLIENGTSK